MSISIQPCAVEDADDMITVGTEAFENDELLAIVFDHRIASPEQRKEHHAWRVAVLVQRLAGEQKFYFKAVDVSSGKLVGYIGMYGPDVNIEESSRPQSVPTPDFINFEADKEFTNVQRMMQAKHIGARKDVWYVQSMVVKPSYQGRGIGSQLLRRGLEEVDKAGQDVFLEASPAGARLYESCGFVVLETCVIRDRYKAGMMMRSAKAN